MVFSSITFLFYFLPWVLVLYYLVPFKFKNVILLASSLLFYGWGEPRIVFLMLLTILVSFFMGIGMEKWPEYKKGFLTLAAVWCLGNLIYFKYVDFFIENINALLGLEIAFLRIALPVGISFYTFQVLSYNVDVYRGEVKAQKNIVTLATYITMFPQLIAGPIVRYKDVEVSLRMREHTGENVAMGMRRFILGLSKKVLIANVLGELCAAFQNANERSVLFYWTYAIAFTLQIYYDFSGYSDMAIGLGKMLGFEFLENFRYPYIAKSITEFWRRWHISLGSWFRDYVYIPLGGSRVGTARRYLNIFIVWMLTGLWHGASWNFVVWGLLFAILLVVEKAGLLKALEGGKIWNHIYVMFWVILGFVIFNADSMSQAWQDIGGLFGVGGLKWVSAETIYYLKSYMIVLLVAIIGATPFPKKWAEKMKGFSMAEPFGLIILLILVTAYLVDGSFNPFLYFRF